MAALRFPALSCRITLGRPSLGWLRVSLALMVMQFHYGMDRMLIERMLDAHPAWRAHLQFAGSGNLAVVGFFVISGYLVSVVAQRRYDVTRFDHLLHFTLARWLRIFPLFLILFLSFGAFAEWGLHQPVAPDVATFFSRMLLLPTALGQIWPSDGKPLFTQMVPAFWGATWTLPYDILFYPLGFALLRNPKAIGVLLGFLIGVQALLALRYSAPFIDLGNPFDNHWTRHAYATLAFCLTAFTSGMAAHLWGPVWERRGWIIASSVLVILTLAVFPWNITAGFAALIALACFAALVHALAQQGPSPREDDMGHITYAVYLLHQFMGSVVLTMVGAYWLGVKFEGGPIARFRRFVEQRARTFLASSPVASMKVPVWSSWTALFIGMINSLALLRGWI